MPHLTRRVDERRRLQDAGESTVVLFSLFKEHINFESAALQPTGRASRYRPS
jgi:hypothetical protein